MNKLYYVLSFLLPFSFVLASCSEEDEGWEMTPAQKELIGTAVNFQPYISDFNMSSRAVGEPGNVYNGGFNRGDMMYIYRQYADGNGNFAYPSPEDKTLPGTIYKYTAMTYGETNIFEKSSWKPYEGKKFSMKDGTYEYSMDKAITKADSIIWENGSTVRFRCWTLSALGNSLSGSGSNHDVYTVNYPDYSVCDWVTVSGPTEHIPMNMRHLGCRLAFAPYGGNSFVNSDQFRIQISTDWEDYMRDDNADTDDDDAADKAPTEAEAKARAAEVKRIYETMCFPAGVDMNDFSLLACEKGSGSTRTQAPYTGQTHQHGANEMTADYIASNIRRPEFIAYAGGYNYMVSVPYDMSKENDGKNITLPSYTRFKVYLRDVNQGDKLHGQAESDYHIFVLSDVMKRNDNGSSDSSNHPFADGLTLKAGYSYQFYVGYYYDGITVTAADNFSWVKQDLDAAQAMDQIIPAPVKATFDWWHKGINDAIEDVSKEGGNYNPEFSISNTQEYQEFIDLVNGNFTYNSKLTEENRIHKYRQVDPKDPKNVTIKWYIGEPTKDAAGTHYTWITQEEAEAMGFLFYNRYHPSDADRAAYAEIDVLDAPYSFFDNNVQRRFTVYLESDLDLNDWKLECVGKSLDYAFAGNFDGQGHTISNVYTTSSQLFGYAQYGIIKNLRVVTTHPMSIVGTCDTERILGCSVLAPSTTGAIAETAHGTCYFVGCIHVGSTTKPLVTSGENFFMYGCMQAASGITGGALCGVANGKSNDFLKPQGEFTDLKDIFWGNFACNYYDTTLSPSAVAVTGATWVDEAGKTVVYNRRQYIRGSSTNILCAKNDNLIDVTAEWDKFDPTQRAALYGLAPWRAMNYGIKKYNDGLSKDLDKCQMHYENNTTGYVHRYPTLVPAVPGAGQLGNVMEVYN